jgi:N-acetylneuraminic acid mutarotase
MGLYFATGFAIDSKGYVCGGKRGPNSYTNELWEYKPTLDQWTQLPNFPGGIRYQLCSFVIDYKAYVGLGTDQDMYRDDMWAFDATSNQWSAISPIPASERGSAMTFSIGQRGYICMGTNGGYLDDLWEYNPFNDTWSSRATYGGTRRKGGVGFSLNGLGYVGTGKGNSGKKSSFHEYHPPLVLGLDELAIEINLFPNPTQFELHISTNSTEIKTFAVIDAMGRTISSHSFSSKIPVHTLPKGNYTLVALSNENQIISQKRFLKI